MSTWHRALLLTGALAGAVAVQDSFVGAQPDAKQKTPVVILRGQKGKDLLEDPSKEAPPKQPTVGAQPNGLPPGAVARLGHTRLRHAGAPTCVAFAPDGKSFVTGGTDGTLRAWSVATGEQVNLVEKPGYTVSALRYTDAGKQLVVNFNDGYLRFLDPATLAEKSVVQFSSQHAFAFSRNGALMATSDFADNTTITETATNLPKLELPNASKFDFRPDGKAIAAGDSKGNFAVYLTTGGKPVYTAKQDGAVIGVAYSPDGKRVAVGVRTKTGTDVVHVYDAKGGDPVAAIAKMNTIAGWINNDALAVGNGADAGIYSLKDKGWAGKIPGAYGEFAVSPDGSHLASTGNGGLRVRLWEVSSGKQLHAENDTFPDPALMVASADGKTVFLIATETAYHWRVSERTAKEAGKLPGRAVAASATGNALLVATPDAVVLYTNFDPAKPLPAQPTHTFKDSAGAKAVALSNDGARVAWAVEGGAVFVADASDTKLRREVPSTSNVLALGFNPAGTRLAVLSRDPFLRLWDVSGSEEEKAQEVWKARLQRGLKGTVAFSPDGKLLTAVSTAQLLVFDGVDAKPTGEIRTPHFSAERYTDQGIVQHAVFSPDSRLLVAGAGGIGGGVEVWEVATRSLVRRFSTGYGGISRLGLFPDGSRVASAGAEEAVTVWDLTFRADKPAPTADELSAAWKALDEPDASTGYPAVKVFVAGGRTGVDALDRGLKEIVTNEKKIKELIVDLGSETFSVRESASKDLVAQGIRALPAVTAAAMSDDPEVRDRALEVLGKLNGQGFYQPASGLPGDALRLVRAVQVLEQIGTAEAKTLLTRIAGLNGRPADEAKAALARLKKK